MSRLPTTDGLLVLDKPGGMTSRDAVNRAMGWFARRTRVGHTGTLDPLATGVLVLCVGKATRLASFVQEMGKEYETAVTLGIRSITDDADGELSPVECRPPSIDRIGEAIRQFVGTIEQVPPAYSAVHVDGKRAHAIARRGEQPELRARPVTIQQISIVEYDWPTLRLRINCGKGTYIRSLARDLGNALGTGGYVAELRRTRVGPFNVDLAVSLDARSESVAAAIRPAREAVAHYPTITLDALQVDAIRHGRAIPIEIDTESLIGLLDERGELLGLGQMNRTGQLKPELVMNAIQ